MKQTQKFGTLPLIIYCLLPPLVLWGMNEPVGTESSYYNFDPNNQTTLEMFIEYVEFIKPNKVYSEAKTYSRLISLEDKGKHSGWYEEYKNFLSKICLPDQPCQTLDEARSLISEVLAMISKNLCEKKVSSRERVKPQHVLFAVVAELQRSISTMAGNVALERLTFVNGLLERILDENSSCPEDVKYVVGFYMIQILFKIFGRWFFEKRSRPGVRGRKETSTSSTSSSSHALQTPEIRAFFSNITMDISKELCNLIAQAKSQILIAIYAITNRNIVSTMIKAKKQNPSSLDIKIIVDVHSGMDSIEQVKYLANSQNKIDVYVFFEKVQLQGAEGQKSGRQPLMHNKYAVFDNDTLWTGSYNFTYAANNYNHENAVVIQNKSVVKSAIDDFNSIINCGAVITFANYQFIEKIGTATKHLFLYTSDVITNAEIINAIINNRTPGLKICIFVGLQENVDFLKNRWMRTRNEPGVFTLSPSQEERSSAWIDDTVFDGTVDCMSGLNPDRLQAKFPALAEEALYFTTQTLFKGLVNT